MPYQPTEAQRRIMEQMSYTPESCKAIAARMPSHISRQNVSMQCRIMADNGVIKQHGRGKFSLKRDQEATLRDLLREDGDAIEPRADMKPKRLQRKRREATTLETFAERFPQQYSWLMNAANIGNRFAISLLSQLKKGWQLTDKQMICIERSLVR